MKIAITSDGADKKSAVDSRFGRCNYFIFYDRGNDEYKAVENKAANAAHGAGIEAARAVAEEGVKAVITGNIGPNASGVIRASSVDIFSVKGGTIQEAVKAFNSGKLNKLDSATVPGHSGQKPVNKSNGQETGRGSNR
ncbi:MAG: NifB/NifX family molybdenum-iron cluster-binding protein, partial [Elusimicrobia bacterium]|nr:NifB/NifX family molybdenum-iron cluster-binding protein [Elusimicrobiota bacterium]